MNIDSIINKYPKSVFLNITNKCNLDCIYCSSEQINMDHIELSEKKIDKVLDQFREIGVTKVILTGGEPLLHNNILDIILKTSKFAHIALNTNGIFIDKYLNDFIQNIPIGVCDINVSLDSLYMNKNSITRGMYNIDNILNNMSKLSKHGINCTILITVTSYFSMEDLSAFCEYAKKNPMINVVFNELKPCGKANEVWESLKPLRKMIDLIINCSCDYSNISTSFGSFNYKPLKEIKKTDKKLITCGAGKTCVSIANDGTLYPCTSLDIKLGNVFEHTLKEIYDHSEKIKEFNRLRNYTLDMIRDCARCANIEECSGGCRANSYLYSSDILGNDPYCSEYRKECKL